MLTTGYFGNIQHSRGDEKMSMSKKNTSLLLIVALILLIAVFAMVVTATTYAGALPWSFSPHFVAHCVGSTCGVG